MSILTRRGMFKRLAEIAGATAGVWAGSHAGVVAAPVAKPPSQMVWVSLHDYQGKHWRTWYMEVGQTNLIKLPVMIDNTYGVAVFAPWGWPTGVGMDGVVRVGMKQVSGPDVTGAFGWSGEGQ